MTDADRLTLYGAALRLIAIVLEAADDRELVKAMRQTP